MTTPTKIVVCLTPNLPQEARRRKKGGRGPVATPTLHAPYLGILERENREAGSRKESQQRAQPLGLRM